MYGSYESTQCVEIEADGEYHEVEFSFSLDCTSPGCKAHLYGEPGDCYQAEAPEFELDSIHVLEAGRKSIKISEEALTAFMSKEEADKLVEKAIMDAIESGEF